MAAKLSQDPRIRCVSFSIHLYNVRRIIYFHATATVTLIVLLLVLVLVLFFGLPYYSCVTVCIVALKNKKNQFFNNRYTFNNRIIILYLIIVLLLLTCSVSVIMLGHVAVAAQPSAKNILNGVMIAVPISRLFCRSPSSVTVRTH